MVARVMVIVSPAAGPGWLGLGFAGDGSGVQYRKIEREKLS